MRLALIGSVFSLLVLSFSLVGCPDKPDEKTSVAAEKAEVERAEPDEDGKGEERAKKADKPGRAGAPSGAADEKKGEGKDEGGW